MRYLLILGAAFLVAFGIPWLQANADEPPAQTVTVTVDRSIDGCNVNCWRRHAALNGRAAKALRRIVKHDRRNLRKLRLGLRSQVHVGASGLERAFLCIHAGEGSWNSRTGNGYYGGLQMDWSFMRSYGGEFLSAYGTADRWTPAMQVTVATRAYLSGRGFGPWPNTARACGLL